MSLMLPVAQLEPHSHLTNTNINKQSQYRKSAVVVIETLLLKLYKFFIKTCFTYQDQHKAKI